MRSTDTTVCRVVGMATRYGLDAPGIETQWGEIFCTRPNRPYGPPNPLYNGYRVSFPGENWPVRGVDHPPSSSVEVKVVGLYTFTSRLCFQDLYKGEIYLYLLPLLTKFFKQFNV